MTEFRKPASLSYGHEYGVFSFRVTPCTAGTIVSCGADVYRLVAVPNHDASRWPLDLHGMIAVQRRHCSTRLIHFRRTTDCRSTQAAGWRGLLARYTWPPRSQTASYTASIREKFRTWSSVTAGAEAAASRCRFRRRKRKVNVCCRHLIGDVSWQLSCGHNVHCNTTSRCTNKNAVFRWSIQ